MRPSLRLSQQLRPIVFTRDYTKHAEGSVLVEYGDTKVLCNVSVLDGVPRFLKNGSQGWLTAEYSMLPRATHNRSDREATRGRQSGRTQEIQRLIGRSLRTAVDLKQLGDYTLAVDCDVIQADGGTRTAAITGSCVALADAFKKMHRQQKIKNNPLRFLIAAVSVGLYENEVVVDLDYAEDSRASTDMNVVMNEHREFIELQGTAELKAFSSFELNQLLETAQHGMEQLFAAQRAALEKA